MSKTNPQLVKFFTDQFQPASVALVGTRDLLGKAIREAQRKITPDGKPSLWSHCFLLGDRRWDRRGPQGALTQSLYLFESDLKLKLFKPQLRNGAQENWVGKWCSPEVEHAAVINFNLLDAERQAVLATALQLVDEQVLYPIQELLGTWLAIMTGREWQKNPLDDPHAMYCSSFVRHCYAQAGKDFMDGRVSLSNTAPGHLAQAGQQGQRMVLFHA
jgi:hypothetical protein